MDAVDRVIKQWAAEKPNLDTEPMAIIGRFIRISKYLESEVAKLHKRYDLKLGEFDVLATLRRSGEPYSLTPSELINSMMLTSGAMTNRLDKLAAKALICREHSQQDRRSVSVQLTAQGLELIDQLVEEHVIIQQGLVEKIPPEQRGEVNMLLKGWLAHFE